METNERVCGRCAYWHPEQETCILYKAKRAKEDFCSSFSTNPEVCDTCGKYIRGTTFYEKTKNRYYQLCDQCVKLISTCAGCKNNNCEFEQNPDPMPKMVMRQVRQGNAIMQASTKNPERIKKFCEPCPCWDMEEQDCNREFNCCSRYVSILNP